MSNEVLVVEETELLVVGDTVLELLEVDATNELLDVAGAQGPPGEGTPGGIAGQVYTVGLDGVTRIWAAPAASLPDGGTAGQILTKQSSTDGDALWEDPQATGATPADIANVMAFAAANG